mmetsp:Transcript_86624/g.242668  ORF Transcript_86624/g.242668 Transcript_86624/m.242668 type:complete len:240 (-) Transcript_86624:259-978(-)
MGGTAPHLRRRSRSSGPSCARRLRFTARTPPALRSSWTVGGGPRRWSDHGSARSRPSRAPTRAWAPSPAAWVAPWPPRHRTAAARGTSPPPSSPSRAGGWRLCRRTRSRRHRSTPPGKPGLRRSLRNSVRCGGPSPSFVRRTPTRSQRSRRDRRRSAPAPRPPRQMLAPRRPGLQTSMATLPQSRRRRLLRPLEGHRLRRRGNSKQQRLRRPRMGRHVRARRRTRTPPPPLCRCRRRHW